MAKPTGVKLLSSLRRSGSASALFSIPATYFHDEDEREAFLWLTDYVRTHRAFPSPSVFYDETGVRTKRTTEPLSYYIDKARQRALYNDCVPLYAELDEAMRSREPDEAVRIAQEIIRADRNVRTSSDTGLVGLSNALELVSADYEIAQWQDTLRGVTTGWPYLDSVTGGWQNADLITFVGRPGRGKTYLMLHSAHAAWASGRSVLFVSMEMGALQIARRFVGIHSGLNPDRIRKGRLGTFLRQRLTGAMEDMDTGVPFDIVVGSFKKSTDAVRALAEEGAYDIIFADASYLLSPEKKANYSARREKVSDTIEDLKSISVDLDRPLVQSVQFNRKAVRSSVQTGGDNNQQRSNPISHLGLDKIGETDIIGQVTSIALGIELFDPPYEQVRRWMGFLKGREGEHGHWALNYRFEPVDFSIIPPRRRNRDGGEQQEINLDWTV